MSMLDRARGWLRKPAAERKRLLSNRLLRAAPWTRMTFGIGFARFANVFWAYHPDSHVWFDEHAEFDPLYARFSRHNRLNNGGDSVRLWSLILNIKHVLQAGVEGDFAELGVWRGNTASVLAHFALQSRRTLFLFDTFKGFSDRDLKGLDAGVKPSFANTSIELVREVVGPAWQACEVVPGYFPESLRLEHFDRRFAVVSVDCDLYEPMKSGLEFFYPRLSRGGLLLLHDYSSGFWPGAKQAVDEFCAATGELPVLLPDKSGSAFIRRTL
jgi:Macrocin-O-methyltransferase (TylF)